MSHIQDQPIISSLNRKLCFQPSGCRKRTLHGSDTSVMCRLNVTSGHHMNPIVTCTLAPWHFFFFWSQEEWWQIWKIDVECPPQFVSWWIVDRACKKWSRGAWFNFLIWMLLSFLREFPWNLGLVIAINEWFCYPFASLGHLALAVECPWWSRFGSPQDPHVMSIAKILGSAWHSPWVVVNLRNFYCWSDLSTFVDFMRIYDQFHETNWQY